jgi:hypothetical protein
MTKAPQELGLIAGTQNYRVYMALLAGDCSRNRFLRASPPITRLAARVRDLESLGVAIKGEKRGRDYVYTVEGA